MVSSLASAANPPARGIPDAACLECHSDRGLTKTDPRGKEVPLFVDEAKLRASVHQYTRCSDCHSDLTTRHPDDNTAAKPVDCAACHEEPSRSFGQSVHGLAALRGETASATCVDCHGSHSVTAPGSPESPLHFSRLAETCGGCHEAAAREVAESVHGRALAAGHREAPTCTDCHSEHKINALRASSPLSISAEVCSNCHASERLNTKYHLPTDRVKTFFQSYHGLAAKYGSTVAANCGSCHGAHKVLPSSDRRSTVHPDNLVATCGKCHPGATENFARSKVHVDVTNGNGSDGLGQQVNHWVRQIYLCIIFGTIGAMALHNGLSLARKTAARLRVADLSVIRMDRSQRIQHMILAISFILLALTGFALQFPDSWLARLMGSSEPFRRWSHRVAGVVLIAAGIYHLWYLIRRAEGRRLLRDLLPRRGDLKHLAQNARYLAGRTRQRPRFGRFGYVEKLEYWAVVWGTVIMGVTGFAIWFKIGVTEFLPRWIVEVATTIHYYEAILACLAIVTWHFYHVMFDPDVYPINGAFWHGRVSRHWQAEEHPDDIVVDPESPKTPRGTKAPCNESSRDDKPGPDEPHT